MKQAFTLIELLAVIVIIAIIALIGVFSVTKIITNSRINGLKNTSLGIKKAASLYVGSNEVMVGTMGVQDPNDPFSGYPVTYDMASGAAYESLLDSSKDPWGNDYERAVAGVYKVGEKIKIDIILKLSNGDIYVYKDGEEVGTKFSIPPAPEYSSDITNLLIGNDGTATSSGTIGGSSYDPYNSFDNAVNPWGWLSNTSTGWLKYRFDTGKTIRRYAITALKQGSGYTPRSWTFEGSNNNTDWTVLDTQNNITDWHTADNATTPIRKQFDFSNVTAYLYYRVNINAGNDSYVGMTELDLYIITN